MNEQAHGFEGGSSPPRRKRQYIATGDVEKTEIVRHLAYEQNWGIVAIARVVTSERRRGKRSGSPNVEDHSADHEVTNTFRTATGDAASNPSAPSRLEPYRFMRPLTAKWLKRHATRPPSAKRHQKWKNEQAGIVKRSHTKKEAWVSPCVKKAEASALEERRAAWSQEPPLGSRITARQWAALRLREVEGTGIGHLYRPLTWVRVGERMVPPCSGPKALGLAEKARAKLGGG
jgi:hypothetical protein